MADLATVRSEIKLWERSFKDSNGRAPTIIDIKENNAIAEKYKLYKRLSKVGVPSNATQKERAAPRLSTPPRMTRPKDPPSVLLSKSRIVQPSAPLAAFNPFSPQKKQKGKERERNIADRSEDPRDNLFGKSQTKSRNQKRSPSPDPFPLVYLSAGPSATSSSSQFALSFVPEPTSAVSRARKRLRGDPVSPSPNKEKRRRVISQTIIPFPRLNLETPISDDEFDIQDADTSFVDNSPIKAPKSGKLFPQLFEETLAHVDLFGVKSDLGVLDMDIDEPSKPSRMLAHAGRPLARKNINTRKDDLADVEIGQLRNRNLSKLSTTTSRNSSAAPSEISDSRSSTKRPVSDDEADKVDERSMRSRSPLIPPSPPPAGASSTFNRQGKNPSKAKTVTQSRKKAKVEEETNDDSDGMELASKLKIVARNTTRLQRAGAGEEDDVGFDSDSILGYARFARPRGSTPNTTSQEKDNHVEVDLPDELRRVLALQSSAPQVQLSEEDRLVKGVIYGRRTTHYDPSKGGEIWDVGEDHHLGIDEDENRFTEGEDEWEGEPVPWEVGEL